MRVIEKDGKVLFVTKSNTTEACWFFLNGFLRNIFLGSPGEANGIKLPSPGTLLCYRSHPVAVWANSSTCIFLQRCFSWTTQKHLSQATIEAHSYFMRSKRGLEVKGGKPRWLDSRDPAFKFLPINSDKLTYADIEMICALNGEEVIEGLNLTPKTYV